MFPFEVFLFFFLVLTGYLITGSLLRERDGHAADDQSWRWEALKSYQLKRGLRILAPYYLALLLGLLLGVSDLREHLGWYFFHVSNFHMATLERWPAGSNHFWSLAMQQQFYLIWPMVIWFLPRKWLTCALVVFSVVAPLSRVFQDDFTRWFLSPQLLTWMSFDYFGIGALLALAVQHGMPLGSARLKWIAGFGLVAYCLIVMTYWLGLPTWGFRAFQQSFLALALCGLIAGASVGFTGPLKRIFEHSRVQKVGQLSYGVYLFHNLAPLVAGKLFWFLWSEPFNHAGGAVLRIAVYALITWALAHLCWVWVESPLQAMRFRLNYGRSSTDRA